MEFAESIFKNIICNECGSDYNVKCVIIGSMSVILCEKCRGQLKELLEQEFENK